MARTLKTDEASLTHLYVTQMWESISFRLTYTLRIRLCNINNGHWYKYSTTSACKLSLYRADNANKPQWRKFPTENSVATMLEAKTFCYGLEFHRKNYINTEKFMDYRVKYEQTMKIALIFVIKVKMSLCWINHHARRWGGGTASLTESWRKGRRYPLNCSMGGPHSRYGRGGEGNTSTPAGNRTPLI